MKIVKRNDDVRLGTREKTETPVNKLDDLQGVNPETVCVLELDHMPAVVNELQIYLVSLGIKNKIEVTAGDILGSKRRLLEQSGDSVEERFYRFAVRNLPPRQAHGVSMALYEANNSLLLDENKQEIIASTVGFLIAGILTAIAYGHFEEYSNGRLYSLFAAIVAFLVSAGIVSDSSGLVAVSSKAKEKKKKSKVHAEIEDMYKLLKEIYQLLHLMNIYSKSDNSAVAEKRLRAWKLVEENKKRLDQFAMQLEAKLTAGVDDNTEPSPTLMDMEIKSRDRLRIAVEAGEHSKDQADALRRMDPEVENQIRMEEFDEELETMEEVKRKQAK